MEQDSIGENHVQNPSDLLFISDNEVKAGIEHERLSSYLFK